MNEKMSKILMLVAGAIGVIAIFFLARIVIEGDDAITASADLQGSVISPFVTFSIIILVLTALVAVVFSAFTLFQQPEQLKKSPNGNWCVRRFITYYLFRIT